MPARGIAASPLLSLILGFALERLCGAVGLSGGNDAEAADYYPLRLHAEPSCVLNAVPVTKKGVSKYGSTASRTQLG
jgi:hypothetical protein